MYAGDTKVVFWIARTSIDPSFHLIQPLIKRTTSSLGTVNPVVVMNLHIFLS